MKIFVSGGINEDSIEILAKGVDGFGVGSCLSNAPTLDFAMDIVSVGGKPLAKRGKFSGRKKVYRRNNSLNYYVYPQGHSAHESLQPALVKYLENGELVKDLPSVKDIRDYVMEQLRNLKDNRL